MMLSEIETIYRRNVDFIYDFSEKYTFSIYLSCFDWTSNNEKVGKKSRWKGVPKLKQSR